MNKQNIKWIAIQPLTGGMYLGTEEAIGHPAEAIISFPGLDNISYDKTVNPINVSNEHYLKTYLTKHNKMPAYHLFNHGMFDKEISSANDVDVKFENIDLVVAVPVCSGLSMATTTVDKETRDSRNCNMKYITHYALTQIRPQIYIFENAPTFVGPQAQGLREWFEDLAFKNGYSITYYKTDTQYHENCQRRPRIFVIFNKGDKSLKLDFEHKNISVDEFFKSMKKSEFNNTPVSTSKHNLPLLDFIKKLYGDDWRASVKGNLLEHIITIGKTEEFIRSVQMHPESSRIQQYVEHVQNKLDMGKNWYKSDFCTVNEKFFPAVQFRSIPYMIHPHEDRTCTVREFLTLMGMPEDFEWYGSEANLPKIGQNVPVKTAKFIVEKALKAYDENSYFNNEVVYQDNIKQKNFGIEYKI